MKLTIFLLFLGMIVPAFAQESLFDDMALQLENQINQDNLKELESRLFDAENDANHAINQTSLLQNQNFDLAMKIESLEKQIEQNQSVILISITIALCSLVVSFFILFRFLFRNFL